MSRERDIKLLYEIADAMEKAGYDPYDQIYGYLKTGQVRYVTRTGGARDKIESVSNESLSVFLDLIKKELPR